MWVISLGLVIIILLLFVKWYFLSHIHNKFYIFKSEIEILFKEANKLLKDADLKSKSGRLECFGCGLITDNVYRCGSCSLAKYCSRVD